MARQKEEDYEDEAIDELDADEDEIPQPAKKKDGRGRPRKAVEPLEDEEGFEGDDDPVDEDEEEPAPKPKKVSKAAPARYGFYVQQAEQGVIDNETQQPYINNMWAAFADIINRLDRLEQKLYGE